MRTATLSPICSTHKDQPEQRRIPTQAELNERLYYDDDTGVLYWKNNRKTSLIGNPAGSYRKEKVVIGLGVERYAAHHLVWIMVYGVAPQDGSHIDHIDGNPHNNRLANLRMVTPAVNANNKKPERKAKEFCSIRYKKGRFHARMKANNTVMGLGSYKTRAEAEAACKGAVIATGF